MKLTPIRSYYPLSLIALLFVFAISCNTSKPSEQQAATTEKDSVSQEPKPISDPLVTNIYTADPSLMYLTAKFIFILLMTLSQELRKMMKVLTLI